MANNLLNTEVGRAMLADAVRKGSMLIPYSDVFMSLGRERWPCYVHYAVGLRAGRTTFTRPDEYRFSPARPGPSDCIWIVPGTTP